MGNLKWKAPLNNFLEARNTATVANTDSKMLSKLWMSEEDPPVYNFLGLEWNMKINTLTPNSYFALGKRRAGLKSGTINENVEEDNSLIAVTPLCSSL